MGIYFDSNRGPQLDRYELEYGDLEADLLDEGPHALDAVGKKNPRRGSKRRPSSSYIKKSLDVSSERALIDTQKSVPREIERELRIDLLQELGEAAIFEPDEPGAIDTIIE
jgi:hypothetical protein